jgi:hypothetical protein
MATITITNTSVTGVGTVAKTIGTAGEAIQAGQVLYFKPSDNKWYKADATTLEKSGTGLAQYLRMAMNDADAADQPIVLCEPGNSLNVGSVLTKGIWYLLSATAGKVCNHGDLTSGQYSVSIGYALSASIFYFDPRPSGVTV